MGNIRGNVVRHSHECRATVVRLSRDCRATIARQSRDIFSKLDRNSRICRINIYSMRLQLESCLYIVYLCREIVANYSRTSLQLSHSSEIGALGNKQFYISLCMRKPTFWVPTRSDTNRAVQSQKKARSLKLQI